MHKKKSASRSDKEGTIQKPKEREERKREKGHVSWGTQTTAYVALGNIKTTDWKAPRVDVSAGNRRELCSRDEEKGSLNSVRDVDTSCSRGKVRFVTGCSFVFERANPHRRFSMSLCTSQSRGLCVWGCNCQCLLFVRVSAKPLRRADNADLLENVPVPVSERKRNWISLFHTAYFPALYNSRLPDNLYKERQRYLFSTRVFVLHFCSSTLIEFCCL